MRRNSDSRLGRHAVVSVSAALVVLALLAGCAWLDRYPTESTVSFQLAGDYTGVVTVHSITAVRGESAVTVALDLTSPDATELSFFNPPGGDIIMAYRDVAAGRNETYVEATIADLRAVDDITVIISGSGAVFLDFPDINRLLW